MRTGVYLIKNSYTGKCYVGSAAKSLGRRWADHMRALDNGNHPNKNLLSAWREFGPNSFMFGILEVCPPEKCIEVEQKWIDVLNPEYNHCLTAGSPRLPFISEETRKKISERYSGENNPFFGKKHTQKALLAQSAAKKGKIPSKETRAKLSRALMGNAHTLGRVMPESEKAVRRGKYASDETRQKLSVAHKASWARRKSQQLIHQNLCPQSL